MLGLLTLIVIYYSLGTSIKIESFIDGGCNPDSIAYDNWFSIITELLVHITMCENSYITIYVISFSTI